MAEFDLLRSVQPSEGWFAVLSIKDGKVQQSLVAEREEVDALAMRKAAAGWDVYYGVAKYATNANRHKENVKALKSLWLDIDCGVGKAAINSATGVPAGYLTQAEALVALKEFCSATGLPNPVGVNSGRGLHVYWPLTEEITREQWETAAGALQALCSKHSLFVDPAVFEVARVLRIPGTMNFKDDPPAPVAVMFRGPPTDFDTLCALLGPSAPVPSSFTSTSTKPKKRSAMAQSLEDGDAMPCSFAHIIERSREGSGCDHMLNAVDNRVTLGYDHWTAALSVANKCKLDRDEGIRMVSEGHTGYDFAAASAKAATFDGPRTCQLLDQLSPGVCNDCQHKGKISSPVVLGYIPTDVATDVCVEVPGPLGIGVERLTPVYPEPFYWSTSGGIYKRLKGEEGKSALVYEHHLYIARRMDDPQLGDVMVMNLHLPKDGVRSVALPNSQISDEGKVREILAGRGVTCGRKQFNLIVEYVQTAVKKLQYDRKADTMRMQFGWADNNTKFVIGDREVTVEGIFHSPPSSVTAETAKHMGPMGSMEGWKEVFSLYGRRGLEPNAFAALTGFGAPLLRYTGQTGGMLNLVHPGSGTGKTTALHMVNSIWGHPKALCALKTDTAYAKILRLGIHNNLPVTYDEITNMEAKEFSELVYSITQGRGRDRMKAATNELRTNFTTWTTMAVCSSNSSFYEKLAALKYSPDGEVMRLIEYTLGYSQAIDAAVAKRMFDHQLMENYGHAGPVYADWLVKNQGEAERTVLSVQAKIDSELKLTQRERVWSAMAAANIAGGLIAKNLDLLDWDMVRIFSWVGERFKEAREEVLPTMHGCTAVVGDFMNRNIQSMLVVDDAVDARSKLELAPLLEPNRELLIRYEPDTKKLFIVAKAFQSDCAKQQINYRETIKELKAMGVYLGAETKRMSKGMGFNGLGVYAIVLNCSAGELLALDSLVAGVVRDESRVS
jgi:hypothetical protein